ncbi:hypothetical protein ABIA16_003588 [Sinorhizobium fredii]
MKMMHHEMPFRLRDLLPAFEIYTGDKKATKFARQIEGMAEFLNKQPRTVEAYLSYSRERMIPADDYWAVAVEWVKRRAKASGLKPQFVVLDDNGDRVFECQWLWEATFLADTEGSSWQQVRCLWSTNQLDERGQRRSRLRRLVRSGLVAPDQVCDVFNFDRHCLVDYQMEGVTWGSTPDELRLRVLEQYAAERLGEAA